MSTYQITLSPHAIVETTAFVLTTDRAESNYGQPVQAIDWRGCDAEAITGSAWKGEPIDAWLAAWTIALSEGRVVDYGDGTLRSFHTVAEALEEVRSMHTMAGLVPVVRIAAP